MRSIKKVSKSFKRQLFFNPLEENVHQTEKKLTCGFLAHFSSKSFFALSRKSWTNSAISRIFVCTGFFGCVIDALLVEAVVMVVVVEHEMENRRTTFNIMVQLDLLCSDSSISPQIPPLLFQEIP